MKLLKHIIKGNNSTTLLVFNIIIIGLAVGGLFVVPFNIQLALLTVLTYFLMISFGISITYHRALTHKALILHPIAEKLGVLIASLAGTGSPIMWVMTHRQHHRYADKPGDPHPPAGVLKTFFGHYPRVEVFGIRDVANKKFNRFLHRYYFAIVLLWGLFLLAAFGYQVFFYVFVLTTFFNISISNALNWFGHKKSSVGYRNYNLKDESQNNPIMAILAFGEGWHNNHHRYPGSAKFGVKKFEIDMSYILINILSGLGLANSVKTHKE